MNVLLVDDNSKLRQIMKELVSGLFSTVYECSSGEQAVDLYSRYRPDWVLMDIKMKGINGIVAAEKIIKLYPAANIIIVTNYSDNDLQNLAIKAGVREYVLKENLTSLPEIIREYKHLC